MSALKIIKEKNYKIRKCQVSPNVKRKWHKGYKYISLYIHFKYTHVEFKRKYEVKNAEFQGRMKSFGDVF